MLNLLPMAEPDTAELRKARGAFFTPEPISRFLVDWAVREATDTVLEPSAGEASFLVEAVRRLRELSHDTTWQPEVDGVEIDPPSAQAAKAAVEASGGRADIAVSDFFLLAPEPRYSVVVGNPPYIRYQDFTGASRTRSRAAALQAGVALTALASSWAAFTIHSALFLRRGGRMGLVLPAELLSVNYASVVRKFLFERFRSVELVLFDEQVFPEAEADVVLLLADGYDEGPTDHATIYQAQDAAALRSLHGSKRWSPSDPSAKWTGLLLNPSATASLEAALSSSHFTCLETWGDTTLGMVTGNNRFFALSPARVAELGLTRRDLIPLSPPGSSHLRGLALTKGDMTSLGRAGQATWLFRPGEKPSAAAEDYIATGHRAGVDQAYKCRVRKPWYKVPLIRPADLLLTCMNADTPRLCVNTAGVHHLNSVHGVYLRPEHSEVGAELLVLASLNSLTLLSAEMVGRSYGGGILKIEPREADSWAMPAPWFVAASSQQLLSVKDRVADLLGKGRLKDAVDLVDGALFSGNSSIPDLDLSQVREAHAAMTNRRMARGKSGR